MALRRTRKVSKNSGEHSDGQLNNDHEQLIRKKRELFIQHFEKEAQERINEMEENLEKLLSTVDRVFKVKRMTMHQSLHTTLIKDLMNTDEASAGEVTIAIKTKSPEMPAPLTRKPSKKGLSNLMHSEQRNKRVSSNSTGNLRCATSVSTKRIQGRVIKLSDQALSSGFESRCLKRHISDSLLESKVFGSMASATISTSLGETLLISEDNKDEINIDLLDDSALVQMQKIKELMEYLCNKVKMNHTH
ncbi:borealin-2 [Chanos chanos]|uniref:Borealin-2 n=1 Tax=Chanos chanos TaxID=29144 RepID=A0A6J2X0U2_CHACN|nr:borealin-2-like [Chanos chanos]